MSEQFVGTGRANTSGGAMTLTAPQRVRDLLDLDDDGLDVVYFERDGRIIVVPESEVSLR